jgi:hypothetical protein
MTGGAIGVLGFDEEVVGVFATGVLDTGVLVGEDWRADFGVVKMDGRIEENMRPKNDSVCGVGAGEAWPFVSGVEGADGNLARGGVVATGED